MLTRLAHERAGVLKYLMDRMKIEGDLLLAEESMETAVRKQRLKKIMEESRGRDVGEGSSKSGGQN